MFSDTHLYSFIGRKEISKSIIEDKWQVLGCSDLQTRQIIQIFRQEERTAALKIIRTQIQYRL